MGKWIGGVSPGEKLAGTGERSQDPLLGKALDRSTKIEGQARKGEQGDEADDKSSESIPVVCKRRGRKANRSPENQTFI